jgi:hypothetical protein
VDVALEFFLRTVGRASSDRGRVQAACGALRALSAIGNVIVFTFTAARVKQEVAKEGIFPFSLYFASSYDFSLRHGFRRLPAHKAGHHLYTQKAPAAAVALHWTITTILILAAVLGTGAAGTTAEGIFSHLPGYSLLMMAYVYGLDIVWFSIIGMGMLWLRLWPGSNWRHKSPIPHALGVAAAVVFTATNVFPLIAIWVPDPMQPFMARSNGKVPWYASQTMTLAILGAAGAYFLGFRFYLWHRRTRHAEVLKVTRIPVFKGSQGGQSGLVLLYEIIRLQWKDWVPEEDIPMKQPGSVESNST